MIPAQDAFSFVKKEPEPDLSPPEFTRDEERQLARVDGTLDAVVVQSFSGAPVRAHFKDGIPQKIADEVARRWRSGGWRVAIELDLSKKSHAGLTSGTLFVLTPARLGVKKVESAALPAVAREIVANAPAAAAGARLLVRMPTRGRPKRALEVLEKYRSMAGVPIAIEVVVDEDDSSMLDACVLQRLAALGCAVTVGDHRSKVEACNGGRERDWDVLVLASDDQVPVRDGYALRILEAMRHHWPRFDGAIYFDDGYQGKNLCTLPIIGRRFNDKIHGFIYEPSYISLSCDCEQTELWLQMGRLVYIDEKIIEHQHPAWGHVEKDALYKRNDAFADRDQKHYEERKGDRRERSQFGFCKPPLWLSICVCTVPERATQLDYLLDVIEAQDRWLKYFVDSREIEILIDDRGGVSIGEKRQALLERAKGHFVAFIDDDDGISFDYVYRILCAIKASPDTDCVNLIGMMTTNGEAPQRFEHSIEHKEWGEKDGVLVRGPNHLNAVRRELALQAGFPWRSHGEDREYSERLRPLLKNEARVRGDSPLYYYWYVPAASVQSGKKLGTSSRRFSVDIADLVVKPHNECFREIAQATSDALRLLGHEVVSARHAKPGRSILFGANDPGSRFVVPEDAVLFNAEQIVGERERDPSQIFVPGSESRVVWDYSETNAERLRARGYRVVTCPVGYVPSMTTIEPDEESIDVLFYGWVNDRRREVLTALADAGLKVVAVTGGFYGRERDRAIARARVVLNLHFYEGGIHEVFRCSHLWANRRCVVTEAGGADPQIELLAERCSAYVPRDQIVDECRRLVASVGARRGVADRGFEEFKKIDFVENVRAALEKS